MDKIDQKKPAEPDSPERPERPEKGLAMWTVTDHPKDFPHCYVARKQLIYSTGPVMTNEIVLSPDLPKLEAFLAGQGLVKLKRHPNDDPVIVASWL